MDQGVFEGLTRDGKPITKTLEGNKETLMSFNESQKNRKEHAVKTNKINF